MPVDNTAEEEGSTATILIPGFFDFKYSPTPVTVPPVPTPATKISIFAVNILVYLRTSVFKMCLGLPGLTNCPDEAVGYLFRQLFSLFNSALHSLCTLREHELSSICLHKLAAFNRHGFRHNDDNAVSSCRRYRCKANAGVSGGRFQ